MPGPQPEAILRLEERLEEGQARDVIEMGVRKEKIGVERPRACQRMPEVAKARRRRRAARARRSAPQIEEVLPPCGPCADPSRQWNRVRPRISR